MITKVITNSESPIHCEITDWIWLKSKVKLHGQCLVNLVKLEFVSFVSWDNTIFFHIPHSTIEFDLQHGLTRILSKITSEGTTYESSILQIIFLSWSYSFTHQRFLEECVDNKKCHGCWWVVTKIFMKRHKILWLFFSIIGSSSNYNSLRGITHPLQDSSTPKGLGLKWPSQNLFWT